MDLDSAVDYYLVEEFTKDWDGDGGTATSSSPTTSNPE